MTNNLTVISLNNKSVDVISLNDLTKTTINNSETLNVSYESFLVDIYTSQNSFTFSNLFSILPQINNDYVFLTIVVIIGVMIISAFKIAKIYSGR